LVLVLQSNSAYAKSMMHAQIAMNDAL